MAKVSSENCFTTRPRLSTNTPDDELAVIENGNSRAHSLCDDNSERAFSSGPPRNSFTGAGAMARVSYFFFMVRNWASHRMNPEVEQHDSFLERFRGPELKDLASRESNGQSVGHDDTLDVMQTKFAHLMAEFTSSQTRMKQRVTEMEAKVKSIQPEDLCEVMADKDKKVQ